VLFCGVGGLLGSVIRDLCWLGVVGFRCGGVWALPPPPWVGGVVVLGVFLVVFGVWVVFWGFLCCVLVLCCYCVGAGWLEGVVWWVLGLFLLDGARAHDYIGIENRIVYDVEFEDAQMVPLPLARDDRATRRLLHDVNPDPVLTTNDSIRAEEIDLGLCEPSGIFRYFRVPSGTMWICTVLN